MWHSIWIIQIPYLEKILRTVLVYALILVIFRLAGKRAIASMNTMDFVVMFLLSNVVQNAIIGNDLSFSGGAIGAVTLVVLNAGADRLAYRYPWVRHLLEGRATTVIHRGEIDKRAISRLGIRRAELDHVVRVQNGDDLSEVWTGVLEPSGQLVLTLKRNEQSATVGDVERLQASLARIEALLAARGDAPGHGAGGGPA